jgi:hypothetical protein
MILLKDKIAVVDDNKITIYHIFNHNEPNEITFDRNNSNVLSLGKHNDSIFFLHLSGRQTQF